jgi:hypothetical protein
MKVRLRRKRSILYQCKWYQCKWYQCKRYQYEPNRIVLVVYGVNKPGLQNLFFRFGARRAMPLQIRVPEIVGAWFAVPGTPRRIDQYDHRFD